MKKTIIKVLLLLLIYSINTKVYANNKIVYNNDSYFYTSENYLKEGQLIPNKTYIFSMGASTIDYSTGTITYTYIDSIIFHYYDENGNFEKEVTPERIDLPDKANHEDDQPYQLINDEADLWEIINIENNDNKTTISLKKVLLGENQVIRCFTPNLNNDWISYFEKANKGDIIVYNSSGGYIGYYNDYFKTEPFYSYQKSIDNGYSSFIVGYEIDNLKKEISTDITKYWISYAGGSCNGTSIGIFKRVEPSFRINCEQNTIKQNSKVSCTLKMKTLYNYPTLNITIPNNNQYLIDNIEVNKNNYLLEKNNDIITLKTKEYIEEYNRQYQEYLEWNDENDIGNFEYYENFDQYIFEEETERELFSFTINKNDSLEEINELNSLFVIKYQFFSVDEIKNIEKTIPVEKIKNPITLNNKKLLFFICIIVISSFIYIHKKSIIKEI